MDSGEKSSNKIMPNDVKLQEGHPVDENLRPIKVGGKSTAIETAQHGNGARINGDLEVTGDITGNIKDRNLNPTIITGDLSVPLSGVVAAEFGSDAIEGTGTAFTTELAVGDAIKIKSDVALGYEIFQVDVITDDDTLEVDSNYAGTTATGLWAYTDPDLLVVQNGDSFDIIKIDKNGDIVMSSFSDISSNNLTIDDAGSITLDANSDITLDADGDNITMKAGSTGSGLDFIQSGAGDYTIKNLSNNRDVIFNVNDGTVDTEVMRVDGSTSSLKVAKIVYFTAETANTIADGATGAIDWNVSQKQKVTITGTGITCNFTNPPGVCNLLLKVVQGDGSDIIATWDSDIKWPTNDTVPTLSTGNGDIDIISFYFDGTSYYGVASLDFA